MEANFEITERCDSIFCPQIPTIVEFNSEIWYDIEELYWYFYPDECAVYLKGYIDGNKIIINDYYVPLQKVYPGYVEITETAPPDIIGHLHSHGSISPFFSSVDLDHLNYTVHVVIGNGNPVAVARIKAECGHMMQRTINIEVKGGLNEI